MTGIIKHSITPLKLSGKIKQLYVTSDFGTRGSGFHHGIDLCGWDGSLRKVDVIVPIAGTVTKNYWSNSCGWCVHIKHKSIVTRYYHLEKQSSLKVGQSVKVGTLIAPMGNTGSTSNGNHLHFEVRDITDSTALDPKPYITGEKKDVSIILEGFEVKIYQNGSTREYVYSTTKECKAQKGSIGSLDPYEQCECMGIVDGCYLVVYNASGTKKAGFVKYSGGVK